MLLRSITLFLVLVSFSTCQSDLKTPQDNPELFDSRLKLDLIAADPLIMTPIGITIDDKDAIYILESHTHSPESTYPGPAFDRIKKAIDQDQDGIPESWNIFADSIEDGMNIIARDNSIFLVTKNKVLVFKDVNHDGISDQRKTLLIMDPPAQVYDHAGLLGIEISDDDWIYISRGNVGGLRYKIIGLDGSALQNFGDGGNVFRCRLDGSQLEEVATGFWNPFGLEISKKGVLWMTDNDPDSRGPNRLAKIVMGADYGYKSLYGGSGIHPFSAWNGELPGTLPYYAGIGEAPCAMIDASFTNLPHQYDDHMLIAIWEENKIISVPLHYKGGDKVKSETLILGDSTFHPVAFAANAQGDIYFTDWVVRQYPNHGKGRLWRLSIQNKSSTDIPTLQNLTYDIMQGLDNTVSLDTLKSILMAEDLFKKTVARKILEDSKYLENIETWLRDPQPELRLQALLIFMKLDYTLPEAQLVVLLNDPGELVRKTVLQYIAIKSRIDLLPELPLILAKGKISPALFESYLSTHQHLDSKFIIALRTTDSRNDPALKKELDDAFIFSFIVDPKISDTLKTIAIHLLKDPERFLLQLSALLQGQDNVALGIAIIDRLKKINDDAVADQLTAIATNQLAPESMRIKAIVALGYQSQDACEELVKLLDDPSANVVEVALRYLGRCDDNLHIKAVVTTWLQNTEDDQLKNIWAILDQGAPHKPKMSLQNIDIHQGRSEKGKIIFELATSQCQNCHMVYYTGGNFGPDLSHIGSSKSMEQLATAILEPSAEIAPEWQGWVVVDSLGTAHLGWQIDVGRHHAELMNQFGEFITYHHPQHYAPAENSLMPAGLANNLTDQDFVDLIAYLDSLK